MTKLEKCSTTKIDYTLEQFHAEMIFRNDVNNILERMSKVIDKMEKRISKLERKK